MKFRYLKPGMMFAAWQERLIDNEKLIELYLITNKDERYVYYKVLYLSSKQEPHWNDEIKDTFDYWNEDHSEMPELYGSETKREVVKGVFGEIE
jgi:hypothetical protein